MSCVCGIVAKWPLLCSHLNGLLSIFLVFCLHFFSQKAEPCLPGWGSGRGIWSGIAGDSDRHGCVFEESGQQRAGWQAPPQGGDVRRLRWWHRRWLLRGRRFRKSGPVLQLQLPTGDAGASCICWSNTSSGWNVLVRLPKGLVHDLTE